MLYDAGLVVNQGNFKSRQLVSVFNCYLKTSHMNVSHNSKNTDEVANRQDK